MSEHEPRVARTEPDPPAAEEGELSDAELECVVGGLTRPWQEPSLTWHPAPRIP